MKFYTTVCKYFIYIHCCVKTKLTGSYRVTFSPVWNNSWIWKQNKPLVSFTSPPALLCNFTLQTKTLPCCIKITFTLQTTNIHAPLCIPCNAIQNLTLSPFAAAKLHSIFTGAADHLFLLAAPSLKKTTHITYYKKKYFFWSPRVFCFYMTKFWGQRLFKKNIY